MARISTESAQETAASFGWTIPEDHAGDYAEMLDKFQAAIDKVEACEDYQPQPDFETCPRENVHRPEPKDNPLNAWAWKCSCTSKAPTSKLLSGKTLCLKDNIAMSGLPCLLGTDTFTDWTPKTDATVVTRILAHGGTITGKAVCEYLSRGAVSVSAATGPVDNPYAKGYSAGGSSSGPGALVGSGAVDVGLGCDQGGSIRTPAALCGLYGFKATFGLVPYTGIASLCATLDNVGPMARTCMDTAELLQAIAGVDEMDDRQGAGCPFPADVPRYADELKAEGATNMKGVKIGILKEGIAQSNINPGVKEKFLAAVEAYKKLGAEVVEVSVPDHDLARSVCVVLSKMANHLGMLGKAVGRRQVVMTDLDEKRNPPYPHETIEKMSFVCKEALMAGEWGWLNASQAYGKSVNLARRIKLAYDKVLRDVDFLVMPTTIMPSKKLPAPGTGPAATVGAAVGMLENTSAFNVSGHPALAVPIGFVPAKEDPSVMLPASMQIVGRYWDETRILKAAYAWEQANDWKTF